MSYSVGARPALRSRQRAARIVGVGAARPSEVISGADLVEPFGKDAPWLVTRTGIESLRRITAPETLLQLAEQAARAALDAAGLEPGEVDAILVATCSGSPRGEASLSERLAAVLAPHAVAFDVNAACSGFCYALSTAEAMATMGSADTVLVVGAEQMSSMIDPVDLGTSILFADGAGAFVVSACDVSERGIGPVAWSSDGAHTDVLEIREGETTLRMQGQQVFRWAVDEVHKVAARAMALAGVTSEEIEVFVPHQANLRIIDAIARKLNLGHATVATDVVESGNTSAASIPMAVGALRSRGATRPGQLALLAGFGAGLSIAAQVVRLP
ncbi:beta-ketoacyl-ACP synthase 3 [Jatrophihabitans sp.]|uniref:beta-ketoacyl-ACP synthase 3 n=1 Tax=Jatrophihabitans sp. TaxID=1932789 RepID=UPI0030C6EE41|nr:3-oxoacyl-[acyl-carrier-protein] synthase [Jatrophihabitans sp.]